MANDRGDWEKVVAERKKEKVKAQKGELGAMQREALAAEYVTGDEHWDLLLTIVMAKIEKLQGQVKQAMNSLEFSNDFSPEVLINQKLAVRGAGREIEALQWVIGLPQTLKEQGDWAKELLGTIDESSD